MGANHDHELSNIGKNLKIGIVLNSGFTVLEFLVGLFSGSLALMSDAGHNLTDALSLVISYSAHRISNRKANEDKTYGYGRATILAALLNATILIVLALYIFYEAYGRIMHPEPVQGQIIVLVAFIGLIINASVALLFRNSLSDLNMRSAFINMTYDALASLGAIVAGILILFTGMTIFDPLISVLIGTMLVFSVWGVVKDALHVLLEGVPEGTDMQKVKEHILKISPLIKNVDDLHIWAISSQFAALSCHIVIEECDLEQSMQIVEHIKKELKDNFKIEHATIETELVECPPDRSS